MIDRRHLLAAFAALPLAARAQGQPPRILVGFPAGGSVDTTARRFAEFSRGNFRGVASVRARWLACAYCNPVRQ